MSLRLQMKDRIRRNEAPARGALLLPRETEGFRKAPREEGAERNKNTAGADTAPLFRFSISNIFEEYCDPYVEN